MSIRKTPFVGGEYYHLYNRGNSKQKIFHDEEDYRRFIALLYTCNSENYFKMSLVDAISAKDPYLWDRGKTLVSIGAYCLMPNHFHILISESEEGGISKFMQKLSTAYAMYYNNKYKRTGGLFEGKFKSQHLSDDRYLKYIFSYIHLNPIKLIQSNWKEVGISNKKSAMEYLGKYAHSSYLEYLGTKRKQNQIIDRSPYPKYFPSIGSFQNEILEWLSYKESY
ncbi:MAG: transposase [Candidatus Zambryskibacteria bacterium]|nr:transposase [Candidatus Zambryskibacteria bacterium]